MGKRAFTLIELLIVIVIIAVLVAIFFPVGMRARQSAHTTVCASNIRQIGVAMQMYADDHGGRWCGETEISDQTALRPYLKDSALYCPVEGALTKEDKRPDRGYYGYAVNDWLMNEQNHLPQVREPARTALVWESRRGNAWENVVQSCDSFKEGASQWKEYGCDIMPPWHDKHNGRGNVYFVDGHVKAVPARDFAPVPPPGKPLYTVEP